MKNKMIIGLLIIALFGFGYVLGNRYLTNNKVTAKKTIERPLVANNNFNNQKSLESKNSDQQDVAKIITYSEVDKKYSSVKELAADATYVIRGKVVNTKPEIVSDSLLYTRATIDIVTDYNGKLSNTKQIEVPFAGGELEGETAKNFIQKNLEEKYGKGKIDYSKIPNEIVNYDNDVENVKKGHELILFLKENPLSAPNKYYLLGSYQGKLKVKDSKLISNFGDNKNAEINLDNTVEDLKDFVKLKK